MRKTAKLLALVASLFATSALADFTGKDASLATVTFKNPNTCTSVVCTPIFAQYDSTGVNAVAVITVGADAASNTANGSLAYTRNLVFNGTTWDRWLGDVTNGAFVNVKASVLPTGAGTAANQTTINTSIGTTNTNLGAQADGAAAADTSTASLIALLKRNNQNLTTLNTTAAAAVPTGANVIGQVGQVSQYPFGAVPITASATGTTAATTATLAASASIKTYICGYSIRANATANTNVTDTVTGVITGTMSSALWVPANTAGLGVDEQIFSPCIPSSAINTAIAVVSGAPGTGGVVTVKAWGYQL